MSTTWYYLDADNSVQGPRSLEDLVQFLRSTDLGSATLVWKEGLESWVPARDVTEVSNQLQRSLNPAPPAPSGTEAGAGAVTEHERQAAAPVGAKVTHPWRRYFARQLDYVLVAFGIGLAMGLTGVEGPDNEFVFGLLAAILLIPVEAFFVAVFGATIGKAIYGIHLTRGDAMPLGFGESFKRAATVCIKGIGLGIPLIALVTCIVGYQTLTKEGATSWDRTLGITVTHGPLGIARWTMIALAWAGVVAVMLLGAGAE